VVWLIHVRRCSRLSQLLLPANRKKKKKTLTNDTSSRLLLLLCFWMLGAGGRTLPHLSLSSCFALVSLAEELQGCSCIYAGLAMMMTPSYLLLYYLFPTNRIRNMEKFLKVSLLSNFGLKYMLHFCIYFSDGFISLSLSDTLFKK
jgi:hypothetical protein